MLVGTLDEYGPVDLALGVAGRTAKLQLKATGLSAGRVRLGAGGSRGTPSRVRRTNVRTHACVALTYARARRTNVGTPAVRAAYVPALDPLELEGCATGS